MERWKSIKDSMLAKDLNLVEDVLFHMSSHDLWSFVDVPNLLVVLRFR